MNVVSRLQWPLFVIAVALYIYFPVWTLWTAGLSSNDFKHIYLGMKAILDGNSPYTIQALHHQAALQGYRQISLNPYVYLPFTGHAMAFLAPLRMEQAVAAWFILNHLFTLASLYLISQMFDKGRLTAFAVMLLTFAFSTPFFRTLSAGQLNMALLFLITLGFHLLRRGHSTWAGVIMAFAALFKLMPGLYGLYFLLTRQWKAAIVMTAAGLLFFGLSLLLSGPAMYLDFLPVLRQMGYGKSTWPHVFSFWDDPANQSLNAFFSHIFTFSDHTTPWTPLGQSIANLWTLLATIALFSAFTGVLVYTHSTSSHSPMPASYYEAGWCATLLTALLIPSLLWDHYLVMLILPVAWMFKQSIALNRYLAAAIVGICYVSTCLPWNFEFEAWRRGGGILLMSFKLWPTLSLYGLSICFILWSVENVPLAEDQSLANAR